MNSGKTASAQIVNVVTAQAPVNIAVIKYWGKENSKLKIPINDSISTTLNLNQLSTTTSVYFSDSLECDKLVLNGVEQKWYIDDNPTPAKILLDDIRHLAHQQQQQQYDEAGRIKASPTNKVHIVTANNFPTAAGLASSAAGYACLAYTLGLVHGLTDIAVLSRIARKGSGSACRSLYGGFVQWHQGQDDATSLATQIATEKHWPELKVVIFVVSDKQKDVPSSDGMASSVNTSALINYRAKNVVPKRITAMKHSILNRDFQSFSTITMQDSNEFHAICLDTYPPIFYLNETSRRIIKMCTVINKLHGENKLAYTFDAGPNACVYVLDDFVDTFLAVCNIIFPSIDKNGNLNRIEIKGLPLREDKFCAKEVERLARDLTTQNLSPSQNSITYIINTSVGEGPRIVDRHLSLV